MNYVLIDGSYFIFHRFYALRRWWKFAKKEQEFNPESEEFVDKYKHTFNSKLLEINKKLKLKKTNTSIIVAKDCPRKDIWRNRLVDNYKDGRASTTEIKPFFEMAYNELFTAEAGIDGTLHHPHLEADDCIALKTNQLRQDNDNNIWIITNDKDYLQLKGDNVKIITPQYKEIVSSNDPKMDLFCKVVLGDKSDNISPVFDRCGVKTAIKYYNNMDLFQERLKKENKEDKYKLNQQLISFEHIPSEYTI